MIEHAKKEYKIPQTEILPLTSEAFEYLTVTRKLTKDTLEAYRVGCSKRGEIAIPFFDENENRLLVKFRDAEGKLLQRRRKNEDDSTSVYECKTAIEPGGKPILLGSHLCDPREGALVICFGDYDAMAVYQDGVINCVGMPFGDKGFGFIDTQWNFLNQFSEIILYPDADTYANPEIEKQAKKKLDELATRLGKHKVKLVGRKGRNGAKDANEILIKFGEGKNSELVENAEWFPSGIVAVADYQDIETQEGTPTGLPDVDRATGGFGGGQLIVVSGDNGAGKTTEVLNFIAEFVKERMPVFLWSGEQKVGKIRYWFERIVAGRLNLKRVVGNKTNFEYFFPLDDVLTEIRDWYREYFYQLTDAQIDAQSFFSEAELGIRRYGCQLIVIDNLMAFTGGEGESYYQAQGDFAQSCKSFAEKWNVPVILICHNRKPPETNKPRIPNKDDIEGSKKITNWADVVIQMYRVPEIFKFDLDGADTILRLCKARESGINEDIRLKFDSDANRFCQMSDEVGNDRLMGWER